MIKEREMEMTNLHETCNRPFCIEDSVMEIPELRLWWKTGKYTLLKTGRMRALCAYHGSEVLKDNAKVKGERDVWLLMKQDIDATKKVTQTADGVYMYHDRWLGPTTGTAVFRYRNGLWVCQDHVVEWPASEVQPDRNSGRPECCHVLAVKAFLAASDNQK
jgi:hypothetical protein